jgi:hypothetical protein
MVRARRARRWWRRRRPHDEEIEAQLLATWRPFTLAIDAHTSLTGRLALLADSARDHAETLERLDADGCPELRRAEPWKLHPEWRGKGSSSADDELRWELPLELSYAAVRPGPREAWQLLDRAAASLTAALDDPHGTYARDAEALRAFAAATDRLRDAVPTGLYCSFCGETKERVKHLIAGGAVLICDDCVGLCVELIEDREQQP